MSKIKMKVSNGIVYLSGQLDSKTDYEKVVTLVESTQGVKDVNVDDLSVKGSKQPLHDSYITAKVRGALIREDIMGRDILAWTLDIETKNGQVYLSGQVASVKEKALIMKVVKAVKGVQKINDKMTLSSNSANDSRD
ncbi:osmotically inducible protein Y [Legionella lansingensis]|uniref:Osmotically inducible protein Y n=1 Tax=Legionella lansingensis TaxID=45067 RepID=A0A0W0VPE0_9GAMM|nr:BON domain-containing protein [Legionella lansingensis]KTD22050.1 osmotically inducible protein Y [Legionella lansingensis]SNV54150.1 osmotically inducible protein Y [Legionella lansingensis]